MTQTPPPGMDAVDDLLCELMMRNGWSVERAEAELVRRLAEAMADELRIMAAEAGRS